MQKFLPLLKTCELFKGIENEEQENLESCLKPEVERYTKGSYVLRAGRTTNKIGILLEGNALIIQEDFWGNCNILAQNKPGEMFGAAFACVPNAILSVSVVANTPVQVLFFRVDRLLSTCSNACACHSLLLQNLLMALAQKNLRINEKLTHATQRGTRARLMSYFSAMARQCGTKEFSIPFTQQQLADYLAVERSGLSNELRKMQRDGLLSYHKKHYSLNA